MGHCIIVAITEGLPEHETSYRTFSTTIIQDLLEVTIAFHLCYYIKDPFSGIQYSIHKITN
jgi:hypothetical protein